jgi:hypothetical protein
MQVAAWVGAVVGVWVTNPYRIAELRAIRRKPKSEVVLVICKCKIGGTEHHRSFELRTSRRNDLCYLLLGNLILQYAVKRLVKRTARKSKRRKKI